VLLVRWAWRRGARAVRKGAPTPPTTPPAPTA
jgi:hypothetical protein